MAPKEAEKGEAVERYEIVLTYETRVGKHEERFEVEVPAGLGKKEARSILREKAGDLVDRSPRIKQAGNVKAVIRPFKQVAKDKDMGRGLEM